MPPRSSSQRQLGRETLASIPPEGAAWGPPSLPPQPPHGWRTLQLHRPQQGFPRWCRSQKLTSPPSDAMFVMKGSRCKHVLGIPPSSRSQRHDKASSMASRLVLWFNQMCHIGITERRRKILTCTQINKNNKSKSLSDYAQQELSVVTRRP
jgi:hypothetical protein